MPDLLLLLLALVVAGALVTAPVWRPAPQLPSADAELEAARLRHRVALEALRDVEADRHAGTLDDAAYAGQLADAEAHAATTRAALDRLERPAPRLDQPLASPHPGAVVTRDGGRTAALAAAGVIGLLLVGGWLVPAAGVANRTLTNDALAAAQAAEEARQGRIRDLTARLAQDPDDAATLSDLADAYLAGSTGEDLARAASALQLLLAIEPDRADAYERIMSAYLRAGDAANARAAHSAYAARDTADAEEVAFFDGLIARAEGDREAAVAAFDRFLRLAPEDPRAEMVAGLRAEAAGTR